MKDHEIVRLTEIRDQLIECSKTMAMVDITWAITAITTLIAESAPHPPKDKVAAFEKQFREKYSDRKLYKP